jgi:hypothetical protein
MAFDINNTHYSGPMKDAIMWQARENCLSMHPGFKNAQRTLRAAELWAKEMEDIYYQERSGKFAANIGSIPECWKPCTYG